jgi:histidine triad (HIT) family protein
MAECVFCKIVAGELPADTVYEDDVVVAFRDINARAPTHILIIPRRHVASLNNVALEDEALVGHIVRVAAQLAAKEGVAGDGYRVVANCGPNAGQSVDHVHFHLLGGRAMGWPPG